METDEQPHGLGMLKRMWRSTNAIRMVLGSSSVTSCSASKKKLPKTATSIVGCGAGTLANPVGMGKQMVCLTREFSCSFVSRGLAFLERAFVAPATPVSLRGSDI